MFHPNGRSIMCISCLENLIDQSQLDQVDQLCAWLDVPFLVNEWTSLYPKGKERTLHMYAKLIRDNVSYARLDWKTINEKWRNSEDLEQEIPAINEQWRAQMAKKWPSDNIRTDDDYRYLENFYNDLCATQNLISATQRDDAKRLCEVGLLATQKIRAGLDAKNEMAIYHNIVKTEGFEPKNSKNIGDFNSIGEVYQWLYERGWKPCWHVEPQDSVDFTMKAVQNYLQRLVKGEGNIAEQVEDRRKKIAAAEKYEQEVGIGAADMDEDQQIDYEGEDLCLN